MSLKTISAQTDSLYAIIELDTVSRWAWHLPNTDSYNWSETEVLKTLDILQKAVDSNQSQVPFYGRKRKILLRDYRKQLVFGQESNGEILVWVNCFCIDKRKEFPRTTSLYHPWTEGIILIHGGGSCYFNVLINLTQGTWKDFYINGI